MNARALTVGGILLLILLGVTLVFQLGKPSSQPRPLPDPNGYDDLVAAANALPKDVRVLFEPEKSGASAVKVALYNSQASLDLIDLGLSKDSRLPERLTEVDSQNHVQVLNSFKPMGRVLVARGYMAESQGDFDKAADSYLNCISLGERVMRGGVFIDCLVGVALQSIGIDALATVTDMLSEEQLSLILSELETLDRSQVSFDEIADAENRFVNRVADLRMKLAARTVFAGKMKDVRQRTESKYSELMSKRLALLIQLAKRAYEVREGSPAESWDQLIPEYFTETPVDPVTQEPVSF